VIDFCQQLLGTWGIVRAELGDAPMPPEAAARVEIEFAAAAGEQCANLGGDQCGSAGGTYLVRFAGKVSDAGHFELFAGKDHFSENAENRPHRQITLYGKTGTNAGRQLPGIFQLRGNRLKLCLALAGTEPPIEFSSSGTASGGPCYLVTYRRKA